LAGRLEFEVLEGFECDSGRKIDEMIKRKKKIPLETNKGSRRKYLCMQYIGPKFEI